MEAPHATAYYLNPQLHYGPAFKANFEVKTKILYMFMRILPQYAERTNIHLQIENLKAAKGLLGLEPATFARDLKLPAWYWDSDGDGCQELQTFATS